MKKRIAIALSIVFLFTAACNNESNNNEEKQNKGDTPRYTFATWAVGEELSQLNEIVDELNSEAQGKYEIIVDSYPSDYYIKLATNIAANNSPDFYWLTQELISKYADLGSIAEITDLLENSSKIPASDFYPGVIDTAEYEDKYYGVPWIANPLIVYYNQDLFDEVNVDYPAQDSTWTWDDFIETAKKLTIEQEDSLGNTYQQYGYIVDGWPNIETFIWAGGGDIIAEDGETIVLDANESIEGLDILHEILSSGITPPYQEVGSLGSNNVWFEEQRVAMFMGGIQDNFEEKLNKLPEEERFNIGYAPMPKCADGTQSAFNWTASTVIDKSLEGDEKVFSAVEDLSLKIFDWKVAPPIKDTVEKVSKIDPYKDEALETIEISLNNARSANYIPEWNEINDMLWLRLYNPMLLDPNGFDYESEAKVIAEESRAIIDER